MPSALGLLLAGCGSGSSTSTASNAYVHNAEEAAALALAITTQASNHNAYGVGGIIVENATEKVIKAMENRVVQPLYDGRSYTKDPTAHGEVQLVTWYYANAQALNLPPPNQLTIVSSLDPCAMCAGTLITSGFNVAVVAYDVVAGINWNTEFNFAGMPPIYRLGYTIDPQAVQKSISSSV